MNTALPPRGAKHPRRSAVDTPVVAAGHERPVLFSARRGVDEFAGWKQVLRAALRTATIAAIVALAGLFVFPAKRAHAGRSCESVPATPERVVRGMQLAERTAQSLDASGAQVVLLARTGQNLEPYGLHWSHLGLAYKTAEGPWRVVHKLNQCGTATAAVYRQGLGEFFLDDPWRFETAWALPTPAVQAQLLAALNEPPARIARLHTAPYSVVSYAWGHKYQQSNQWAIETLAADSVFAWLPRAGLGAVPVTLKL